MWCLQSALLYIYTVYPKMSDHQNVRHFFRFVSCKYREEKVKFCFQSEKPFWLRLYTFLHLEISTSKEENQVKKNFGASKWGITDLVFAMSNTSGVKWEAGFAYIIILWWR